MTQPYGLIGEIKAAPGKGAELAAILREATVAGMPGNIAYLVASGIEEPDSVFVTEVWESREAHAASLQLPEIRQAIDRGRPLIAGMGMRIETVPLVGD